MTNMELYNSIQNLIQAEIEPYKLRVAELEAELAGYQRPVSHDVSKY